MFNVIEYHQDSINKVFATPDQSGVITYPSGAGSLPYSFGWSNKYSPKPFGPRLYADTYSIYANSNIYNYSLPRSAGLSPFSGPLNAVYQVSLSGFSDGNCVDCSGLNGDYLLYRYPFEADGSIGVFVYTGFTTNDQAYWATNICNKNKPVNLCGIDNIQMTFGTDTQSSGQVKLNVYLNRFNARLHSISDDVFFLNNGFASGNIVFSKDFGYISGFADNTKSLKPYMLEEAHNLTAVSSGNNTVHWSTFFGPDGAQGDTTTNNFTCDLSNVSCTVTPYKSQFYDVRNISLSFMSGVIYPIIPKLNGFDISSAGGGHYEGGDTGRTRLYSSNNYYEDFADYRKVVFGGLSRTQPSGYAYQFSPPMFKLNITGLSDTKFQNDCRTYNEYYSKDKNLTWFHNTPGAFNQFGNPAINQIKYLWSGTTLFEGRNSRLLNNYYNICDHGCNIPETISVEVGDIRQDDFTQGPCSNYIILLLNESGMYDTDAQKVRKVSADLLFGAVYNSGNFFIRNSISRYALTKTLCDDNTTIKCRESGLDSANSYANIGLLDLFDSGVWSGGWTKKINDDWYYSDHFGFSNSFVTPPELDIFNYEALESGNVFLTPVDTQSPCADWRCNIIDNVKVPQSVSSTVTWLDSSYPSGYSTPQTLMASLDDNDVCYWRMNTRNAINTSGDSLSVGFATISQGHCIFTCSSKIATVNGAYWVIRGTGKGVNASNEQTFFNFDTTSYPNISGVNIGTSNASISGDTIMTRNIDLSLYNSGSPTRNFNLLAHTSGTLSIKFSDFYDIRDYL